MFVFVCVLCLERECVFVGRECVCHTVALVLAECPKIRDIHHGLLSLVDPLIALGLTMTDEHTCTHVNVLFVHFMRSLDD